jgi:hypothetical protein
MPEHRKTVGEYEFIIQPMPPLDALELLGDLQKVIGPVVGRGLAAIVDGIGEENEDGQPLSVMLANIDGSVIADAFEALAKNLDGKVIRGLMSRILNGDYVYVTIGDKTQRLDNKAIPIVFAGNLSGMFKLAGEVLSVNYGDFFASANSAYGKLKLEGQSSPSPEC